MLVLLNVLVFGGLAFSTLGPNPPSSPALAAQSTAIVLQPIATNTRASISPTPTFTATSTGVRPNAPAPALYIDGPFIRRSDTHAPVWLKGVNVEEFRQPNPHTFADLYNVQGLGVLIRDQWGINLLRVAVDPETVKGNSRELDKLVAFAQENGIYILLVPFASAINPARSEWRMPIPDALVATAMSFLAARYRARTNVLYGVWNEPHPETIPALNYDQQWQMWMPAAIRVARAIRDANPNSILVVPGGTRWSRDLSYYQQHPFPFASVVYDVHDYSAPESDHYSRDIWTWAIGKYPLLIGEVGGNPTNPSDPASLAYMKATLAIVNQNPGLVHYAMYVLSDDGVWGIFTRARARMPKGDVLFEDLLNLPPTRLP